MMHISQENPTRSFLQIVSVIAIFKKKISLMIHNYKKAIAFYPFFNLSIGKTLKNSAGLILHAKNLYAVVSVHWPCVSQEFRAFCF